MTMQEKVKVFQRMEESKSFQIISSCQFTHEDPGKSNDGDTSGKHEDKDEDHLGMNNVMLCQ